MYAKCSACPVRCWVGGESHWGPLGISDPHPKCPAPGSRRSHKHNMGPKGRIDILSPLLSIRGIAAGRRLMGPFYILSIALSLPMVLQSGVPTPWCMPNTAFNLCHPPSPSLFPAKNSWLGVWEEEAGFFPMAPWRAVAIPSPFQIVVVGGREKKCYIKVLML